MNDNIGSVLNKISSRKKQLGQYWRRNDKKTERESLRKRYICQQNKLGIYEIKVKKLEGYEEFIKKEGKGLRKREPKFCKQKWNRGRPKKYPDYILYS